MTRKKQLKNINRIVVKVGTSTITEDGSISSKKISKLVSDVYSLKEMGYQVVIVSSGAITAGSSSLKKHNNILTIPEKQALASIGQIQLMNEYRKYFQKKGCTIGQILLTEDDLKNRRRFLNARHTLNSLLNINVIPIINENDSVVVKEIKFGDNDTLSAHVSSLIEAELLILLTDIDGFFLDLNDKEPVDELYKISDRVKEAAGGTGTEVGTGGMITKINAAEIIMRFGEKMIIANGKEKNILTRIMNGEKIGTIFIGREKSLSSRKKWLTLKSSKGRLFLDDGAVDAIINRKKSLLASGIKKIDGNFDMGDVVELLDANGAIIAKGLVNYKHDELEKIKGKKTGEIKNILGSKYFDEVINRDDLIVY